MGLTLSELFSMISKKGALYDPNIISAVLNEVPYIASLIHNNETIPN